MESKYVIEKEIIEATLPAPETLLTQFAGRPVFTLTETAEERLTSTYWLSSPSDEVDNDLENVRLLYPIKYFQFNSDLS